MPGQKSGLRLFAVLLVALLGACALRAQTQYPAPLPQLFELAGVLAGEAAPDALQLAASPTLEQQLPLYKAMMAQPLNAPYRIGMLAQSFTEAQASPQQLVGLTGAVAGLRLHRRPEATLTQQQARLRSAADPLASSLLWMADLASPGSTWSPALPDQVQLPDPLRFELAMMLASIGSANRFLQRALVKLPASATPALLRRQALDGVLEPFEEPDYRQLLPLIEREALLAGMLDLVAATARLKLFVSTAQQLPTVAWTLDTPMGQIVVDSSGQNNLHQLKDPLLVLDVGGDDSYQFLQRSDSQRISVLLDHRGNDHYRSSAPGADPSSATMGYGILWDTEGNDQYQGTQQAQGSALFGAALLVDGGGNNQFVANSHAQGHAIGGLAVLLGSPGHDTYVAQTHAQGSAGPLGVALLLDPAGDDRYTLDNTPLHWPSSQLPSVNTSMEQGAGRGLGADFDDGRYAAGGIGMLLDLAGNDHYVAQVFAQGAGYQEGLGVLVDDAGNDQFDAAWYAMGAAAHQGAGILLKRGSGNDHYRASHVTSIGAAHDFSVAIFLDEGGDDHYALGDLGLGAAHDNSFALFVDGAGDDHYQVTASACRALGVADSSGWGTRRESLLNLGLFMDLGGTDSYPPGCPRASNNSIWPTPRRWPELKLRSEAGAGFDGVAPLPLAVRALTRPLHKPPQ